MCIQVVLLFARRDTTSRKLHRKFKNSVNDCHDSFDNHAFLNKQEVW